MLEEEKYGERGGGISGEEAGVDQEEGAEKIARGGWEALREGDS